MFEPLALAERWSDVHTGAQAGLLVVREGPVLLGTFEYRLRLPTGAVLATGPGELQRLRCAGAPATPRVVRAALDAEVLPQLYDPDSDLAMQLARSEDADAALDLLYRAQHACEALIVRCSGRTHARRREQYLRLARARAVLAWGESAPLDIARVAEIARLSPHYFVEMFHRVFGTSPHRYRIERRMQEARRLVAHTRQPIREILNQLGLDSHSTFTRVFRRQFGMSATSLRAEAERQEARRSGPLRSS